MYMCVYLEHAALPDSVRVSQEVKVRPSDLDVLDAADVRPADDLSPSNQTDSVNMETSCDTFTW